MESAFLQPTHCNKQGSGVVVYLAFRRRGENTAGVLGPEGPLTTARGEEPVQRMESRILVATWLKRHVGSAVDASFPASSFRFEILGPSAPVSSFESFA
eukprot:2696490-Pyramimonas_sp.AAC.1